MVNWLASDLARSGLRQTSHALSPGSPASAGSRPSPTGEGKESTNSNPPPKGRVPFTIHISALFPSGLCCTLSLELLTLAHRPVVGLPIAGIPCCQNVLTKTHEGVGQGRFQVSIRSD